MKSISWVKPNENRVLKKKEVHLWRNVVSKEDYTRLLYLKDILSIEEQERCERFYFEKDKMIFIISHGLLRILLSKYLNENLNNICFSTNNHGKLELKKLEHQHLKFNLAHSENLILLGFVLNENIGVDIELVKNFNFSEKLLDFYLTEIEKNEIIKIPKNKMNQVLFNIWTCKEAYVKAKGKGLKMDLKDFSVSVKSKKTPELILPNEEEIRWNIKDISEKNHYSATVVVSGTTPNFVFYESSYVL